MAITNIQAAKHSAGTTTSLANAFTSNPTAGNSLFAFVHYNTSTANVIPRISDSIGNRWIEYINAQDPNGTDFVRGYYCPSNKSTAADTVMIAGMTGSALNHLTIYEFNFGGPCTLDKFSGTGNIGTTATSNLTTVPAYQNELLIGACWGAGTITGGESTWPADISTDAAFLAEYYIATNVTTQVYATAAMTSSARFAGVVGTFFETSQAPSAVQLTEGGIASALSNSVTYNAAQTVGNTNVLLIVWQSSSIGLAASSPVVDTKGNTYTQIGSTITGGAYFQFAMFYCGSIKAAMAGANVVTVTFASGTPQSQIMAMEFPGSLALDQTIGATANSTGPCATGSMPTTSSANDLLLTCGFTGTNFTDHDSGFVLELNDELQGFIIEDEAVSATGVYSSSCPMNGAYGAVTWAIRIVAFKPGSVPNVLAGSCTVKAGINHGGLIETNHLAVSVTAISANTGALSNKNVLNAIGVAKASNHGALSETNKLAGTLLGRAANSGLLVSPKPLIGTCTGRPANSGILVATKLLASVSVIHAANSGSVSYANDLAGVCHPAAASHGTLGAVKPLIGVCQAHAANHGSLYTACALKGSAIAHAANTGTIIAKGALVGPGYAHGASGGAVTVLGPLSGSGQGKASSGGSLRVTRPLTSVLACHAVGSGSLVVTHNCAGSGTVRAANAGLIKTTNSLAAIDTIKSASAGILRALKPLAGAVQGKAANAGTIFLHAFCAGILTARGSISGLIVQTNKLVASCSAKSASTGLLRATKVLAGSAQGHFTNSGNLVETIVLSGSNQCASLNSGTLRATKPLAGAGSAKSVSTGLLRATIPLAGAAVVHGANSGPLTIGHSLSGTLTAHASSSGVMGARKMLAGSCVAKAAGTGSLKVARALVGICTVHGNGAGNLTIAIQLQGLCVAHGIIAGTIRESNRLMSTTVAHNVNSGKLTVVHILSGPVMARSANHGTLVSTANLSAVCTVQGTGQGLLTVRAALAGSCTVRMTSYGALRGLLISGICTARASNSGVFWVPEYLWAVTTVHAANSGALRVVRGASGTAILHLIAGGNLRARQPLTGDPPIVHAANFGTLTVTRLLAGTCTARAVDAGSVVLARISTLIGYGGMQGSSSTGAVTVSAAVIPPTVLSGIATMKGSGTAKIFVSPPIVVLMASVAEVFVDSIGTLTQINALAGTSTAVSLAWGTFALPLLNMAATCTVYAHSTGTLLLIANPIQITAPPSYFLPMPVINDIEQMPVQMALAYSAMYELPTANLGLPDLINNLKGIRWIIQGDAQLVTPAELQTLWTAYGIDPDVANVDPVTMAILITRYLFNMPKRHNAWGYCSNTVTVQESGASAAHTSTGTCLINVEVESTV